MDEKPKKPKRSDDEQTFLSTSLEPKDGQALNVQMQNSAKSPFITRNSNK